MVAIPKNETSIDDVPLGFGKHKGKTPNELFEEEEYGYLCWLYENIDDRTVISEELYEEAGIEKEFNRDDVSW